MQDWGSAQQNPVFIDFDNADSPARGFSFLAGSSCLGLIQLSSLAHRPVVRRTADRLWSCQRVHFLVLAPALGLPRNRLLQSKHADWSFLSAHLFPQHPWPTERLHSNTAAVSSRSCSTENQTTARPDEPHERHRYEQSFPKEQARPDANQRSHKTAASNESESGTESKYESYDAGST